MKFQFLCSGLLILSACSSPIISNTPLPKQDVSLASPIQAVNQENSEKILPLNMQGQWTSQQYYIKASKDLQSLQEQIITAFLTEGNVNSIAKNLDAKGIEYPFQLAEAINIKGQVLSVENTRDLYKDDFILELTEQTLYLNKSQSYLYDPITDKWKLVDTNKFPQQVWGYVAPLKERILVFESREEVPFPSSVPEGDILVYRIFQKN